VSSIIEDNDKTIGAINYIICTDKTLLEINNQYLKHDYYTDIITFDQSDDPKIITGDIYISLERVKENAKNYRVVWAQELHRVMVHGILHLLGYRDKTEQEKSTIRSRENFYLSLLET